MADELLELGARGRRRCRPGEILRSGFTTRAGTRVAPVCVPDKGAPGKTPPSRRTLPTPEPGSLKGWRKDLPVSRRREAVKKVADQEGCATAIRRLTLLRNITADRATKAAAKADADWVRGQGFCKLVTKERGRRSRKGRRSRRGRRSSR